MEYMLTVTTDYVPDWGIWEAVREILKNAIDAGDWWYPTRMGY